AGRGGGADQHPAAHLTQRAASDRDQRTRAGRKLRPGRPAALAGGRRLCVVGCGAPGRVCPFHLVQEGEIMIRRLWLGWLLLAAAFGRLNTPLTSTTHPRPPPPAT